MDQLKAIGNKAFKIYYYIGVAAMGVLAVMVFFAVVMRYCFALSWKEVSEFNVTLFAFTTFWGMGVNVIKGEHVMIDMVYSKFSAPMKKVMSIVNYVILLVVDLVFTYQGYLYATKMGTQISQGMEVPMLYMYGIMPVSGAICAVCVIIKLVEFVLAPASSFDQAQDKLDTLTQ